MWPVTVVHGDVERMNDVKRTNDPIGTFEVAGKVTDAIAIQAGC